jgi:glycosyltransferase involved in cell wall biosynthesis
MACGKPVIAFPEGAAPELVIDGETGLLGEEGDRVALADNIRELLADDPLREKMGEQARRHVESYFDLRKQTRLLEEVYAGVTAR